MTNKTSSPQVFLNIFLQVALILVVSAGVVTVYDHLRYRPVFTVDVESIMAEKMKELKLSTLAGNENTEQIVSLSKQWARELETEVLALARDHNAIILARPAVVEGSVDMTQHIMSRIIRGNHR